MIKRHRASVVEKTYTDNEGEKVIVQRSPRPLGLVAIDEANGRDRDAGLGYESVTIKDEQATPSELPPLDEIKQGPHSESSLEVLRMAEQGDIFAHFEVSVNGFRATPAGVEATRRIVRALQQAEDDNVVSSRGDRFTMQDFATYTDLAARQYEHDASKTPRALGGVTRVNELRGLAEYIATSQGLAVCGNMSKLVHELMRTQQ